MNFFTNLFRKNKREHPEDLYVTVITDDYIKVTHPQRKTEEIAWKDINEIKLLNTNQGPWLLDVWLALYGDNTGCLIPQGSEGFEKVYDIISKYDGFNFENVTNSMRCTNNAEFGLWKKSV